MKTNKMYRYWFYCDRYTGVMKPLITGETGYEVCGNSYF